MSEIASIFVSKSRRYLSESYLPKIEAALTTVSDDELWWRPNEASNSLGNLLLHLSGSTRYWVASVVGGMPSGRIREQEFTTHSGPSGQELLDGLREAVREADEVLARLTEAQLLEARERGSGAGTVFDAVYHAVEHFSMHTGQILQLVKHLKGVDLGLTR